MIKKFVYLSILILVLNASCKNKTRRLWHRIAQANEESPAPARDYSVTKENAYNDIFLDSSALDKFIASNAIGDSISENMRDFYNVRNFEFAWFDSKGLTEPALGFRSLYKFSTDSVNKQLDRKLDDLLLHENKIDPSDASIVKMELQLTKRFVEFSLTMYKDEDVDAHIFETFVPIKKQSSLALADSILSGKNKYNEKYAVTSPFYQDLKLQLAKYVAINKKGGWDTIPFTKTKFIKGNNFPELLSIKKRLNATGEFMINDTTTTFTPELDSAIRNYQSTHGITPDGKITRALIKSMNVSAIQRIQQILVNMERMRWMPVKREGKLILVNIPEFMLHVTEGNKHVMHMAVVVGKEGHTTTMFSDDLDQIVFSPYWNIPTSIVKAEILPSMKKNKNYLKKNNMEIVSDRGGVPEIRQLPGPKNSLGRVKFLFPNTFNIYLHDTPVKSLFERDNRAASHGCIRISDPVKMANYLLQDYPQWTPEKIEEAMNRGVEKTVQLKHSVPVIITYYTAWVDENKKMNFREDIYGNDSLISAKMFSDVK
jgi:peptidoglycan hydrolase-like protein with peptidoglycan-binding domain